MNYLIFYVHVGYRPIFLYRNLHICYILFFFYIYLMPIAVIWGALNISWAQPFDDSRDKRIEERVKFQEYQGS